MADNPIIQFRGISKRFPGVQALRDINFDVARGSCHALCGENGAGKSTLGKILAGIYAPDEGELIVDGKAARFGSPSDAMAAGIGIVHQELAFCENLTVAENLCLGQLPFPAVKCCGGPKNTWLPSRQRSIRKNSWARCPSANSNWSRSPRRSR